MRVISRSSFMLSVFSKRRRCFLFAKMRATLEYKSSRIATGSKDDQKSRKKKHQRIPYRDFLPWYSIRWNHDKFYYRKIFALAIVSPILLLRKTTQNLFPLSRSVSGGNGSKGWRRRPVPRHRGKYRENFARLRVPTIRKFVSLWWSLSWKLCRWRTHCSASRSLLYILRFRRDNYYPAMAI